MLIYYYFVYMFYLSYFKLKKRANELKSLPMIVYSNNLHIRNPNGDKNVSAN